MTDEDRDAALDAGRMTIWEHLAELRTRLIRCAAAVAVGVVIGWIIYPPAWDFLVEPYKQVNPQARIIIPEVAGAFLLRMQTSLYLGIALAMPVLLW
jgi:sec-independent protein translocase protein TatC